jgi:transaldolase/glucose-6-phosphate isomerase
MNSLKRLNEYGQVVWLDYLSRGFINDGSLRRLIEEDGLTGVTSNPSIFEKAILGSDDYDISIRAAGDEADLSGKALFERIAVEDIKKAANALRPVYDKTGRRDGYVSIEVSPDVATLTEDTVIEARRLWHEVGRENLMIKVPGTGPGLPAIRQLIAEGINVNITLLFSQKVYEEVVAAYLHGLEDFVDGGGSPGRIASVASFFVSRIDTAVDKIINERLTRADDDNERRALASIRGKIAIANAKLAYQSYKRLFSGPRWSALRAKGAQAQRLLWASTGTKNPRYSDVLYVEELIGADTVNTMPLATMNAFRDHGKLHASLENDIENARHVIATLEEQGISLDDITAKLLDEGIHLFTVAMDQLLHAIAQKRASPPARNRIQA